MSQTNVREGYGITTLEVVELVEDLISYLLKSLRSLTLKDWLAVAKCTRLRNAQILKYGAKVKTEDLSNTLTPTLSETAQRWSSSVVFNRSTASITDKFGVASLTKPAILNDANVALVDAVHYSVVMDALTMTLIEDDDDLLGTVNSYIKLRRLRAPLLLEQLSPPKKRGRHSKLILDGPPLKRRKTEAADSRYAKASGGRTKKDKDSEDSDTSSDQLGKEAQLKKTRDEEELAKAKKEKEEKEARDDDYRSDSSSDIDPKDDLEDEEATTAKDLNEVVAIDLANSTWCDLSDLLALRFCFFSDSPPENMGRLTKEEAIEMRIDTTDAISKALAAANKLTILEANTPAVHPEATKHRLALSAARFVIVCSFGKVDKHVFRAYNTISVTAQRTIIRKGGPYIEKRAILLPGHVTVWGQTVFDEFYNCKSEGTIMANCKVKRFTLNSVKDLFTNLSKDYFLVREARAITKSSLKFQNLSNLCSKSIAAEDAAKAANTLLPPKEVRAKILIGSYKPIVQAVTWLGLREKFSDESVLVMQGGMIQHEINLKLAKWRDLDRPWIMVALMAFAEAITLTEATHVVIMELQDRQNI
ncbi:hypothetical protein HBI94_096620 [Parastagonospora nodorum]|nr:hypothetical protein HBI94_096620 [Parastagonospora nodorum]